MIEVLNTLIVLWALFVKAKLQNYVVCRCSHILKNVHQGVLIFNFVVLKIWWFFHFLASFFFSNLHFKNEKYVVIVQKNSPKITIDCSLNIIVIMNSFFHNFMGHSPVKLLLYWTCHKDKNHYLLMHLKTVTWNC